ncbi:hypothetical protein QNH20_13500 [Neobacillus sp. WH10]|uniref:hypothetical protein n=1 Tax=Neobacillus sp. WH10 TaxID=3047873 RepID=UPI0024C1D496|nr:hypothetical protein [Neobacillus sp. WH10]WHY75167.1 hypothetical protein QNH20_13500 [Neobacillus sp. WH10]
MYQVLFVLILFTLIISIVKLMLNRKWTLIYTAFGYDTYFAIAAKLKSAGVKYKTITPLNFRDAVHSKDNTQYDVYVKKGEEHLVYPVLHGK